MDFVFVSMGLLSSLFSFSGLDVNHLPSLSSPLQVKPHEVVTPFGQVAMDTFSSQSLTTALIGIQVEQLSDIAQKTPATDTQASTVESLTEFSQKMLQNFYNFASSFAVDPTQTMLKPGETYLPASVLQQWYTNFQRRLEMNPNFWKTL